MKKIGLFGLAVATIVAGDIVLPPSLGLETLSGKSLEPLGSGGVQVEVGGVHAAGAGSALLAGDQVIATGGVEGYDGCEGVGIVLVALLLPPVPHDVPAATVASNNAAIKNLKTFSAGSVAAAYQLISDTPRPD